MSETLQRLHEELHRFDFIGALRALETTHPHLPRQGHATRPNDECVRLSQNYSTHFQGAELDSFTERSGLHDYQLFCNFLGLLGVNGPLPLHYTEYADQRARHFHDPTFASFIDLFNHRMLSLFYRAVADFDPAINLDRVDSNGMATMLAAIGGIAPATAGGRDRIPDYAKLSCAAWMGGFAKSPDGIVQLILSYFNVAAQVQEFTGGWLTLPDSAHTVLGSRERGGGLGRASYLGRRTWSISHKFTVTLGPLSWQDYLSFKPGSPRATALLDLLRNYLGDEWDWDVRLVVQPGELRQARLDRSAMLGFSACLGVAADTSIEKRSICLRQQVFKRLAGASSSISSNVAKITDTGSGHRTHASQGN